MTGLTSWAYANAWNGQQRDWVTYVEAGIIRFNSYRIFQNFNRMGRFIGVVAVKGSSKVSIIVPEISENVGWSDFAEKIKRFVLEKEKTRYEPLNSKSGEFYSGGADGTMA